VTKFEDLVIHIFSIFSRNLRLKKCAQLLCSGCVLHILPIILNPSVTQLTKLTLPPFTRIVVLWKRINILIFYEANSGLVNLQLLLVCLGFDIFPRITLVFHPGIEKYVVLL
jgi:hypothetical protein